MLKSLFSNSPLPQKDYAKEIAKLSSYFVERDEVIALSTECVGEIKEKWLYYNHTLKFRDGVPQSKIIESFISPVTEFVNNKYPILLSAGPPLLILMVFSAIQQSQTLTAKELNKAAKDMRSEFKFL